MIGVHNDQWFAMTSEMSPVLYKNKPLWKIPQGLPKIQLLCSLSLNKTAVPLL